MAKEVRKTIGIFVNGKEVENNLKSIKAAIVKVSNELNKMTVGTDEYNAHAAKLSQLKKIYDDYKEELKYVREELEAGEKAHNNFVVRAGAMASVINTGYSALQKFVSSTQEYVEAYASIDDAMSGVMKTTGMTREEVESLNESLKSIDTRTSQEELLTIAQIGGRMGLAKDQILDFTKAVDLANVALGDSFSGGAEEISSVLGKISLAFKETRDANIGDSLTRIGSAINEVGGKANATEPNIAAFVQRVGSMPEAFRPSVQEAVALGAAFEESSIDAEVASRAFGILMNKASTDVEGFAQVMGKPVEAVRELINSNPTQFFTEFAKSLQGMDATQIGETLKGLKLNADGVVKIVGAMSGSYDRFNEILQVSNSAFSENTSLMNEFNNVNNNSAAQLEKARKRMQEARVELGEKLIPILTSIFKILGSTSAWITKHIALVASLVTGIGAIVSILGVAYIKEKAMLAMEKAKIAVETIHKSLIASKTVAVQSYNLVLAKQTKNTVAQVAAQEALNTAMKSTPWGLIAIGIASLISALVYFIKRTRESKAAMDEFNSTVAKEQAEVDYLFNKLKNAKEGTDEYKEALQQLIDKYPEVMAKHIDEKGRLDDINQAYQDIIQSIQTKIAVESRDKAIQDATANTLEKQRKLVENMRKRLLAQVKNKDLADTLVNDITKVLNNGDKDVEKYRSIDKILKNAGATRLDTNEVFSKSLNNYIGEYMDAVRNLKNETESITESFDPFIEKPLSEVEKLQKEMNELQLQMQKAEDKEPYKKQIDALKEQIRLKKEAQKTTSNPSSSPSPSSSSSTSSSEKDPIADFEKKLADFRKRQQNASLEGWAKTKQGIIDSYQEMIDEANNLNQTETAKGLETERDNAIIAAGQKYIKDAGNAIEKILQEADEMLDSSSKDGKENKILEAVAGTQKQWDEKIKLVHDNYETIKKILEDDDKLGADDPNKLTSEQRAIFQKGIEDSTKAELELTSEKMQAITNVIKQNVTDETKFITDKETELRRSRMSDYDRQIDEINALYDAKIEAKRKEIETLQQLQQQDGADTDGIQQQIDDIEKLIAKLEELKGTETSNVKKTPTGSNIWENLLNIDWKNFKDNWQENLDLMTRALQEFANAAFDILNSINQIQANREQAELDQFIATQDEKSKALQRQLEDGIISQKYYNAQMDKMQKEKEAKEKKLQHDQFERDRKSNLAKVAIEGGLAVATAFAQYGWPWGLIPAALSTAMTVAQTAMIASQVNPYAKGGYIRKEQIALMGEEGQEWVASNRLLTDRKTAPLIAALEDYQRGNSRALEALALSQPDWNGLSQSAKNISTTFAGSNAPVVNNYNSSTDNSEVLKELKQMNAYLKDPKNRQAYISRRVQLEYEHQENELKAMARL